MEIIRIPGILTETSKRYIYKGRSIGFVPTMGGLHDGHISLIKRAKDENDIVVVSIFINPIQFGPKEDFDRYPRNFESDIEKLRKEDIDILFMPDVKAMYPEGFSTYIEVKGISDKLCGKFRPGHFVGVATIVCKLFNIVMPTRAYFGQKDYQQTLVIKRMVKDLNISVDIIVCPTIREYDGIAMSTRNCYLNPDERKAASIIYKTLVSSSKLIKSGGISPSDVNKYMVDILSKEPLITEIQYAGIYDTETLDPVNEYKKINLLAIALKIGDTRLIDNILIELDK